MGDTGSMLSEVASSLTEPMRASNFRIQNKRVHLTYAVHLDASAWLEWSTSCGREPLKWSIVREQGSTGHLHTHVLVEFKKMVQSVNPRLFDYEGNHPNIKLVRTSKHWTNVVEYHCKQGVPVSNISHIRPGDDDELRGRRLIETIWNQDTVGDALLNVCRTTRDVGGIIAAFNTRPIMYGEEPHVEWYPWQKRLLDEVSGSADDRRIVWYWDPVGNSGKTFIAKHLGMYKGAFVSTRANVYHVATMLQDAIGENGGDSVLIVIFNFTRTTETHRIYSALESLKDGLVTSEKYRGKTMYFQPPHVVVFANYLPDVCRCSLDRWNVRIIAPNGRDELDEVSSSELRDAVEDPEWSGLTSWYQCEREKYEMTLSTVTTGGKPPRYKPV